MALDPLTAILDFGGKVLERVIPDPTARAAAQVELAKLQQSGELAHLAAETEITKGQLAINQEDSKNPRLFVSGWRPFVGWVCGAGFAYAAILEPVARFVAAVVFGYKGAFPVIDTWLTVQVLCGLLGLGALRTREKEKRVAAR
jgi:hypothetical protein